MKMGLREYARHRGVSLKAVQNAIAEKRIIVEIKNGKKLLDSKVADKEWAQNTHPAYLDESESIGYQEAKARKEFFQSKMAEIEYKKRVGELLDAKTVKNQIYKCVQITKDNLLNIPQKLSPQFAAQTDSFDIEMALTDAINQALSSLSTTTDFK